MPSYEDVKHAKEWGMTDEKYKRVKLARRAQFTRIGVTNTSSMVCQGIPSKNDEPGSGCPAPPHLKSFAKGTVCGGINVLSVPQTSRYCAAGVFLWRVNPKTKRTEVLMVWEDECVPISFPGNISPALAVPLFALSYAFTTSGGSGHPHRLPRRPRGGSTSSEASATTQSIPPTRYVPCCAPLPIAVDAENGPPVCISITRCCWRAGCHQGGDGGIRWDEADRGIAWGSSRGNAEARRARGLPRSLPRAT